MFNAWLRKVIEIDWCIAEKNDCNFGQGNKGVANIGSFNCKPFFPFLPISAFQITLDILSQKSSPPALQASINGDLHAFLLTCADIRIFVCMACVFGQGLETIAQSWKTNLQTTAWSEELIVDGDFNMANSSRGDCNLVDGAWGIGGPEYRGCPIVSPFMIIMISNTIWTRNYLLIWQS